MELLNTGRIVLAVEPADWRWGIRSLTSEARTTLGIEDFTESDVWAVWCNRHRDAVRILHYTTSTVTLFEQRLRYGKKYAQLLDSVKRGDSVSITREELQMMLSGQVGPLKLGTGYRHELPPTHEVAGARAA